MRALLIVLAACGLMACALQPINEAANPNEIVINPTTQPDYAQLCQAKGFSWDADNLCRYTENIEGRSLELIYPIELVPAPLIESSIDSYFAETKQSYLVEAEYPAQTPNWYLSISVVVYRQENKLISLRFSENRYSGGPHPNLAYRSFTFDMTSAQLLSFSDLFVTGIDPLTSLVPLVRNQLEINMQGFGMADFITAGTDEMNDFRNFALTDTDLLIFFQPYEVAPYAAGPQEVAIPLSTLAGILRDF